jgi:FixJ family two-component response regulator
MFIGQLKSKACCALLTSLEQQVTAPLVSGLLNKDVGGEARIGEATSKRIEGRSCRR